MVSVSPIVLGCAGCQLTSRERALFMKQRPFGLILFERNIKHPLQVAELVNEFRACVGRRDALVFVDQEGGRISRLDVLQWRHFPSASQIGRLYRKDGAEGRAAAKLLGRLMGEMMRPMGINVTCAPVADLFHHGADPVIGQRSYGEDPEEVGILARCVCDGLMSAGVYPVIKHIPGHGRATEDSHKTLPVVDADLDVLAKTDFVPFVALRSMPFAMTAHILYPAIDGEHCASLSKEVVGRIIRRRIGFRGLLMCDDIGMQALSGDLAQLAVDVLAAGCDIALYCKPDIDAMEAILERLPGMSVKTAMRWRAVKKMMRPLDLFDAVLAQAEFDHLVSRIPAEEII